MSNYKNPLTIAIELVTQERRHQDNKVIQAIFQNFKRKFTQFQLQYSPKYYDPLSPYMEALSGQSSGYSLMLSNDTITSMMIDPAKRLIDLAVVQAIAEQLIFALQAEGEEIDY